MEVSLHVQTRANWFILVQPKDTKHKLSEFYTLLLRIQVNLDYFGQQRYLKLFTLKPFYSIKLRKELIDNPVGHPSAVVATPTKKTHKYVKDTLTFLSFDSYGN